MRHTSVLVVLLAVLLATLPAQAQMVTITPEQIGQIFCIGSLGNDMTPAHAMASEDLQALVAFSFERNSAFELANPGEKPPLGDGLPWRSFPDYADGCAVGPAVVADLVARVPITYSFTDYPDATYTNELILLPAYYEVEGDPLIWRIDDIDLGDGQTLRGMLGTAFDE